MNPVNRIVMPMLGVLGLGFLTGCGEAPDPAKEAFEKGVSAIDRGDFDTAIADFTEAIRLDPTDANRYCNRGIAHCKKGDYDLAIGDLSKAIELKPDLAVRASGEQQAATILRMPAGDDQGVGLLANRLQEPATGRGGLRQAFHRHLLSPPDAIEPRRRYNHWRCCRTPKPCRRQ